MSFLRWVYVDDLEQGPSRRDGMRRDEMRCCICIASRAWERDYRLDANVYVCVPSTRIASPVLAPPSPLAFCIP